MSDTLPTGEEESAELDGDQLAEALDLGITLSEEEQAEAEQMVARLRSQFGLDETSETPEEEPEPAHTEPEPVEEEPEVDPPPPPAPPDPFAGLAEQDIRSLLELRNYLQANPEKAQKLYAEPEPEPPKIPEWIDQDEPAQVAMWNHLQSLEQRVAQTAQSQNQIAQSQAVTKAQGEVAQALGTFRTSHPELTEEDVQTVRLHAVSLDIIDGLAKHMAGTDAVLKALDLAYWDHAEFRAKAVDKLTPSQAKAEVSKERKAKLAALGGSSGSVARQEPRPDLSTDHGAKQAAAQWLREQNVL